MRHWILGAAALALATACGASPDATKAFDAMKLGDGKSGTITWASKGGSGDTITLNDAAIMGQLKIKKLSFGGMHMVGDKPSFKDLVFSDVTTAEVMPGLDFNIGTIEMKNLAEPVGTYLATSMATQGGAGEPPPFESWSFDTMGIKNVVVKIDGAKASGGATGGSAEFKLAETSVSGLKNTVFATGVFKGLTGKMDIPAEPGMGLATPIKGTFDFGDINITNIQSKPYVALFSAAFASTMTGDPSALNTGVEEMTKAFSSPIDPGYDSYSWTGLKFDVAGLKASATPLTSKIDRNAQGQATKVLTPRASLKLDVDPAGGILGSTVGQGLSMVDMKSVELTYAEDMTYDPATDIARINDVSFGVTDALDFKVKGGFKGLAAIRTVMMKLNMMDPMTGGMTEMPFSQADLAPFGIVDLDIELADKNLIGRVAKLFGPDPAAMRADIARQVQASAESLTAAGLHPTLSAELAAAVSKFISNGGTLKISMKPATPVVIGEVADPKTLDKAKLGFSATTTP